MDAQTYICRMVTEKLTENALSLQRDLHWFSEVINARLKMHFNQEIEYDNVSDITPPVVNKDGSMYDNFIRHYELTFGERFLILLTLTPHINPELLDVFFQRNEQLDRGYTEFGGIKGNHHGGFIPTGETAMFILAGDDLQARISLQYLFDSEHFFSKHNILKLEPISNEEPFLSGVVKISREYLDFFTTGEMRKPNFSSEFPARLINTDLEWGDLVLDSSVTRQIDEIRAWMEYGDQLMNDWDLGKKIRPGYRSLFYGPPGTGKTMTACLLGKSTGKDVYKIDLSMVVSKYIGETEKNLAKVFEQAEHKDWILFFDEADALFGKRTSVDDAHDKYANQEVSFLLQRIESFNGIVILASNIKSNIDEAFTRRFESIINFQMPKADERHKIWSLGISEKSHMATDVDLKLIANKYELSGGSIMNVVRYISLMALTRNSNELLLNEIETGIKKEFLKEGKTF